MSANRTNADAGVLLRTRILDAIEVYIEEHNYPPTAAEIGVLVGRAKRTVNNQLTILEQEGRITRGAGPRALTIRTAQ